MTESADLAGAREPQTSLPVIGTIPSRLTAPGMTDDDVHNIVRNDPLMAGAVAASIGWQTLSGHAKYRESAAVGSGLEVGRVYDLTRYQAAAGEKLAMSITTGLEAALWVVYRERKGSDPEIGNDARAEMAHRAVAELQSYYLLAAGHDLINITARALALDPPLRPLLLDAVGSGFPRGSVDKGDFLAINAPTAKGLRKVARQARLDSLKNLPRSVTDLAINSDWCAMVEDRGEHFHRLRAQSHGILGLSAQLPWTFGDTYRAMDLGLPEPYSETQGLAEKLTRSNRQVLGHLASAMSSLSEDINTVLADLGVSKPALPYGFEIPHDGNTE